MSSAPFEIRSGIDYSQIPSFEALGIAVAQQFNLEPNRAADYFHQNSIYIPALVSCNRNSVLGNNPYLKQDVAFLTDEANKANTNGDNSLTETEWRLYKTNNQDTKNLNESWAQLSILAHITTVPNTDSFLHDKAFLLEAIHFDASTLDDSNALDETLQAIIGKLERGTATDDEVYYLLQQMYQVENSDNYQLGSTVEISKIFASSLVIGWVLSKVFHLIDKGVLSPLLFKRIFKTMAEKKCGPNFDVDASYEKFKMTMAEIQKLPSFLEASKLLAIGMGFTLVTHKKDNFLIDSANYNNENKYTSDALLILLMAIVSPTIDLALGQWLENWLGDFDIPIQCIPFPPVTAPAPEPVRVNNKSRVPTEALATSLGLTTGLASSLAGIATATSEIAGNQSNPIETNSLEGVALNEMVTGAGISAGVSAAAALLAAAIYFTGGGAGAAISAESAGVGALGVGGAALAF